MPDMLKISMSKAIWAMAIKSFHHVVMDGYSINSPCQTLK